MSNQIQIPHESMWATAIRSVFTPESPHTTMWTKANEINAAVLNAGKAGGTLIFPGGGDLPMKTVVRSRESGCVEFVTPDGVPNVIKVATLHFEYIDQNIDYSFFLFRAAELQPVEDSGSGFEGFREELGRTRTGKYVDRFEFENQPYRQDKKGKQIQPPVELVVRRLRGTFLWVDTNAGRDWYMYNPMARDGMHEHLPPGEIRKFFELVLRGRGHR